MNLNIKFRAKTISRHMRRHWVGVLGASCIGAGLMGYTADEHSVAQASVLAADEPLLLATSGPSLADLIPPARIPDKVSVSLIHEANLDLEPVPSSSPSSTNHTVTPPIATSIPALANSSPHGVDAAHPASSQHDDLTTSRPAHKRPAPIMAPVKDAKDKEADKSAAAQGPQSDKRASVATSENHKPPHIDTSSATTVNRSLTKTLAASKPVQTRSHPPTHTVAKSVAKSRTVETPDTRKKSDTKPTTPGLADPGKPVIVRSGDSLARILKRQSFRPELVQEILALGKPASALKRLHPGDKLFIDRDKKQRLARLDYSISAFKSLQIRRTKGKLEARVVEHPKVTRIREASGTIRSSFYEATHKSGIPAGLSTALANIFEWDIDFARNLRKGDTFSIIYEQLLKDGKAVGSGKILAAEFTNRGKQHRAIRFQAGDVVGYYDENGRPLRKAFLRTPVKYTHISSRFTPRRWHPILKRWRSHKGVDYAAPRGTPIRATGRGTIKTIGKMRGYGNVVMIQHANKRMTVYGHMNRFARGLKRGSRVQQGQVIGYVGSTGYATGPHLHYEFRINGKHRDPLKVKLPKASPLPKRWMNRFREQAEPLVAQLDVMQTTVVARNDTVRE